MIADRHQPGAERTYKELIDQKVDADTFIGDMSSWETTQELMATTMERFGKIDVLVNAAGGSMYSKKLGWEYSPEELLANIKITFDVHVGVLGSIAIYGRTEVWCNCELWFSRCQGNYAFGIRCG